MLYIQRKDSHGLETVDECETRKEAFYLVQEYSLSDRTAIFYISSRGCKDWLNR